MANGDGLNIKEDEFDNLNEKKQRKVLFQNLMRVRQDLSKGKVRMKVGYWWLTGLSVLVFALYGIKSIGII